MGIAKDKTYIYKIGFHEKVVDKFWYVNNFQEYNSVLGQFEFKF